MVTERYRFDLLFQMGVVVQYRVDNHNFFSINLYQNQCTPAGLRSRDDFSYKLQIQSNPNTQISSQTFAFIILGHHINAFSYFLSTNPIFMIPFISTHGCTIRPYLLLMIPTSDCISQLQTTIKYRVSNAHKSLPSYDSRFYNFSEYKLESTQPK